MVAPRETGVQRAGFFRLSEVDRSVNTLTHTLACASAVLKASAGEQTVNLCVLWRGSLTFTPRTKHNATRAHDSRHKACPRFRRFPRPTPCSAAHPALVGTMGCGASSDAAAAAAAADLHPSPPARDACAQRAEAARRRIIEQMHANMRRTSSAAGRDSAPASPRAPTIRRTPPPTLIEVQPPSDEDDGAGRAADDAPRAAAARFGIDLLTDGGTMFALPEAQQQRRTAETAPPRRARGGSMTPRHRGSLTPAFQSVGPTAARDVDDGDTTGM